MKTIESTEEVKSLLREIYIKHKLGMQMDNDNVYLVGLPKDGSPKCREITSKKYETVFDILQATEFEKVYQLVKEIIPKENPLIIKDAWDFLRQKIPLTDPQYSVPLRKKEDRDYYYLDLKDLPFKLSWETFVGSRIINLEKVEIFPNFLTLVMIYEIYCIDQSVYGYRGWVQPKNVWNPIDNQHFLSEKYILGTRRQRKWWYKLFHSSHSMKRSSTNFKCMGNLILFKKNSYLSEEQVMSLPSDVLQDIQCNDGNNIEGFHLLGKKGMLHIRSHYNHRMAAEQMMHNISQYDNGDYSEGRRICFLEYSFVRQLEIIPFLKEHFNTDRIVKIKAANGDIRLTVMELSR